MPLVAAAGEHFLVSLYSYSGTNLLSLNHLRYILYKKSAFRYSSKMLLYSTTTVFKSISPGPAMAGGLCYSNMCLNCEGNCNNITVVSQDEDELDLETELDCPPIEPMDPMEEEQTLPQ
ncbi:hypothetical protein PR048_012829, partial [Dryococelus australis]